MRGGLNYGFLRKEVSSKMASDYCLEEFSGHRAERENWSKDWRSYWTTRRLRVEFGRPRCQYNTGQSSTEELQRVHYWDHQRSPLALAWKLTCISWVGGNHVQEAADPTSLGHAQSWKEPVLHQSEWRVHKGQDVGWCLPKGLTLVAGLK